MTVCLGEGDPLPRHRPHRCPAALRLLQGHQDQWPGPFSPAWERARAGCGKWRASSGTEESGGTCEEYWCYGADMSGSTEKIEAVARAICAKLLAREGRNDETPAAEVDTYWHIVAAELEAGIIEETGEYVGELLDWTRKMDVYRDWMRRHPESRAVWETVRFGAPPPQE